MATTKTQRIGIWIIAIFMAVGTVGSFAAIVLAGQNDRNDQARLTELMKEYQDKVNAQQEEYSDKYYPIFKKYADAPKAFDADSVKKLAKKNLKAGDGEVLTEESEFTAYYIGWNPEGKVFDSSFNKDKTALEDPFLARPGGVIKGWSKGVVGMKVGGIREVTIPADMAYGAAGSGEDIPPNTPLKFIIMVVPEQESVEPSQELQELYSRLNS